MLWYKAYLKDNCEVCGGVGTLQGHHFYYKGSFGFLRYDEDNHITLCKGCHFALHHRDPKKIEQIIIEKRGNEWLNRLREKSKEQHFSFQTILWYNKNIERLTKLL